MWLTKKGLKSGTQTFGATRPSLASGMHFLGQALC